MGSEGAANLLRRKPRIFWGRVIAVLIRRGWSPPPPDKRIVEDLMEAMDTLDDPLAPRQGDESLLLGLSPQERAICALLIEGLSNEQIAEAMGISQSTVKFHLSSVYNKLGVKSRVAAMVALTKVADSG